MSVTASIDPILPFPGDLVTFTVTSQAGTVVEWRLVSSPADSAHPLGSLLTATGDYAQSFRPDADGVYTFVAVDWNRVNSPARYQGDPTSYPSQTNLSETTILVIVASKFSRPIGAAPDVCSATIAVRDSTTVATALHAPATSRAGIALQDANVLAFAHGTVGQSYTAIDRDLVTKVNDLRAKYEAHRLRTTGGTHANADSTNAIASGLTRDSATLDGAIAVLNDIRAKFSAHIQSAGGGGAHTNPDTDNVVVAPAASDLVSAHALADDLWRAYEAHRVYVSGTVVHGAADATNTLAAQFPLAALNSAFISAARNAALTIPLGLHAAGVKLVNAHGFHKIS